ncbi:MAG: hypothetical protein M0R77_01145 [Gammaproteobacteria bacterium]|nr:hypothetical protein [Acholeplasmataceae bacterium]MCK9529162.1 hypothetical protein [Gammaproteobacteria bacterium]
MFNIFKKQKKSYNTTGIDVLFYKQSNRFEKHGQILVNNKSRGLHRTVVDFSILGAKGNWLPHFTPATVDAIFMLAIEQGYEPISIVEYDHIKFTNDYFNPHSKLVKLSKLKWDNDGSGLYVQVTDYREPVKGIFSVEVYNRLMEAQNFAVTPDNVLAIFELVEEQGYVPITISKFRENVKEVEEQDGDELEPDSVIQLRSPNVFRTRV